MGKLSQKSQRGVLSAEANQELDHAHIRVPQILAPRKDRFFRSGWDILTCRCGFVDSNGLGSGAGSSHGKSRWGQWHLCRLETLPHLVRLVCGFDSHTTLYASRFVKGKASLCVLDGADMASSGWPQVIGTVAENFRELTHLFAPKLSHWFV